MGDLKTRLSSVRAKILRRPSVISTTSSASSSARDLRFGASHSHEPAHPSPFSRSRAVDGEADGQATRNSRKEGAHVEASKGRTETLSSQHTQRPATPTQSAARPTNEPLPQASRELTNQGASTESTGQAAEASSKSEAVVPDSTPPQDPSAPKRPREGTVRQQSLVPHTQTRLVEALLNSSPQKDRPTTSSTWDNFQSAPNLALSMVSRKIWVKRPGASATMVTIHEEDLVDDVRDMVLRKYGNSLGRSFDSPDVTLRICPREGTQHNPQEGERVLGPEEAIARTLDSYYPGGQTVDEALIIDVPQRRTPRPSPRANHPMPYYSEDLRPPEAGTEYFPPMPATAAIPSPHLPPPLTVSSVNNAAGSHHPAVHSISVLNTGQVPLLPSPGSRPGPRHRVPRPGYGRQHTASPTIISSASPAAVTNGTTPHPRQSRSRVNSLASESTQGAPAAPPLPSPPVPEAPHRLATPPPQRVASPRPPAKSKKSRKGSEHPTLPAGLLDGAVPPINVLIVEDNIINLKILEVFMKRLKVRWQTAMNGREAVNKWRTGGFHLVLMDIQLPVMNGLEATREIRRLERLNNIGVFSSSASSSAPENLPGDAPNGDDRLTNTVLFKSPVIIVALTASSLQSDRHEALAAGCNDFLTKVWHDFRYHISCSFTGATKKWDNR
ncbi:MAG: hypothetical protein M1819_004523 [Sarea resinae]|nr:MAG: hypothetical protein M1819_004523 [Sarea resinae]